MGSVGRSNHTFLSPTHKMPSPPPLPIHCMYVTVLFFLTLVQKSITSKFDTKEELSHSERLGSERSLLAEDILSRKKAFPSGEGWVSVMWCCYDLCYLDCLNVRDASVVPGNLSVLAEAAFEPWLPSSLSEFQLNWRRWTRVRACTGFIS